LARKHKLHHMIPLMSAFIITRIPTFPTGFLVISSSKSFYVDCFNATELERWVEYFKKAEAWMDGTIAGSSSTSNQAKGVTSSWKLDGVDSPLSEEWDGVDSSASKGKRRHAEVWALKGGDEEGGGGEGLKDVWELNDAARLRGRGICRADLTIGTFNGPIPGVRYIGRRDDDSATELIQMRENIGGKGTIGDKVRKSSNSVVDGFRRLSVKFGSSANKATPPPPPLPKMSSSVESGRDRGFSEDSEGGVETTFRGSELGDIMKTRSTNGVTLGGDTFVGVDHQQQQRPKSMGTQGLASAINLDHPGKGRSGSASERTFGDREKQQQQGTIVELPPHPVKESSISPVGDLLGMAEWDEPVAANPAPVVQKAVGDGFFQDGWSGGSRSPSKSSTKQAVVGSGNNIEERIRSRTLSTGIGQRYEERMSRDSNGEKETGDDKWECLSDMSDMNFLSLFGKTKAQYLRMGAEEKTRIRSIIE
jgi:hypothetical protein